jgi:hypothetical protein
MRCVHKIAFNDEIRETGISEEGQVVAIISRAFVNLIRFWMRKMHIIYPMTFREAGPLRER